MEDSSFNLTSSSNLNYVTLKVSKITTANEKTEQEDEEKYLLQIINMDNKVLYHETKAE